LRLSTHREADEVGTDTEASTLTSRNTDARADNIKDGEDGSSNYTEGEDVLERERLSRDKDSGNGYKETLYEVFDEAVNDFSSGVHGSIFLHKIFLERRKLEVIGLNKLHNSRQNA
jgi:hypothetical protein